MAEVEMDTAAADFNARIRAKRSHLFDETAFENLLSKQSVQGVVDGLAGSAYDEDLVAALEKYEGADAVEAALSQNLVHTFQRLTRMAQGELRELVKIFLMRWDLMAVKALLRNVHHGITGEEARDAVFPGPTMSLDDLSRLAAHDNMEGLIGGLMAWNHSLCRCLRDELDTYRMERSLRVLEEALDRAYFVDHARRLRQYTDDDSRFLRRMLQLEIDRINLRNLLQSRGEGVDAETILGQLLPNGTLSENVVREMAAAPTPDRALDALRGTPYGDLVEELGARMQVGRISSLDRLLERMFMTRLRRASLANVFGIGLAMRYTWQKYNEVMNIRLIARGIARDVPQARIREEMVYG